MKHPVLHTCLLMSLLLASCAGGSAGAQDAKPEFRLVLKNPGDTVTVLDENSRTVIDIQSDSGIGSASLELVSGSMPDTLLLRLHLRGLEEFRLISEKDRVSASVSSGEVFNSINERILVSGLEVPIGSLHPMWIEVRIVSETGDVPLETGYFEIVVPGEFTRQAGNSFEIQWIDFYR
jgi:hypothetical protein